MKVPPSLDLTLNRTLSQCSKFYYYLLNLSIVTRWILFIVPVLGILWIPGILSLTMFPNAKVFYVLGFRACIFTYFRSGKLGCYGGVYGYLLSGEVSNPMNRRLRSLDKSFIAGWWASLAASYVA